jgi:hypothetical protein
MVAVAALGSIKCITVLVLRCRVKSVSDHR